eukprot:1195881-Prorocentrum_minimum.AAC.7
MMKSFSWGPAKMHKTTSASLKGLAGFLVMCEVNSYVRFNHKGLSISPDVGFIWRSCETCDAPQMFSNTFAVHSLSTLGAVDLWPSRKLEAPFSPNVNVHQSNVQSSMHQCSRLGLPSTVGLFSGINIKIQVLNSLTLPGLAPTPGRIS